MYKRFLPLVNFLEKKSHFLFGPRSTGKTTLIRQLFPGARLYDLLEPRTYGRILDNPSLLEEEHREEGEIVIIDEIQKFPALLDEIHRLIELKKYRFLLAGSSTRKLKEIKSSHLVQNKDLKGIRALKEENLMDSYMVVSLDTSCRQTSDGIHIFPWREFLESLWKGNIL